MLWRWYIYTRAEQAPGWGLPAPIGLEREGYFSSGENELFECDTVVSRDTCSRSWRICAHPTCLAVRWFIYRLISLAGADLLEEKNTVS